MVGRMNGGSALPLHVRILCSDMPYGELIRQALSVPERASTVNSAGEESRLYVLIVAETGVSRLCGSIKRARRDHYRGRLLGVAVESAPAAIARVVAAGADDYVPVPDRLAELPYRVMALQRRQSGLWTYESISTNAVSGASASLEAQANSQDVGSMTQLEGVLTRRERQLLRYLRSRPGVWVSATELLTKVCDCPEERDSTLVRVHLSSVRRKLRSFGGLLESRRTYGYRWLGPSGE